MSELQDIHRGIPAAVLGGGPSLPGDMKKLPAGCLLIAVNEHASQICNPDYLVFNDNPDNHEELLAVIRATKAIRVSEHQDFSDVEMDQHPWSYCYSSTMATWLACWMGCEPVILCGMDCYQGDQVYFHPHVGKVPAQNFGLDFHLRPWIEEGKNKLPHVERVKVMSGPLVGVFGQYKEA
jgi:hypothetical protein